MSRINAMSESFVMLGRSWCERMSASESNPLYLRAAFLAYARCLPNGHTPLIRGALSLSLTTKDPDSGLPVTPDRRTVHDAVRNAVSKGFLLPGSSPRCLIVPREVRFARGGIKAMNAACPWCAGRGKRRAA